jgi:hypothetical protein
VRLLLSFFLVLGLAATLPGNMGWIHLGESAVASDSWPGIWLSAWDRHGIYHLYKKIIIRKKSKIGSEPHTAGL